MRRVVMGAWSACLLVACSPQGPEQSTVSQESEAVLELGVATVNFDASVRSQDDFFLYVNGTWLRNTEIPEDKSNYGAFTEVRDKSENDLKGIVEEAARSGRKVAGSEEQKVGDFYLSFMNTERIDELGLKPLEGELARIAAIADKRDVIRYIGYSQVLGVPNPFVFFVNQDARKSTEYIGYMHQAGLGLPDRDYYFDDSDKFVAIRAAYVSYIEKLFDLAGFADGAAGAATIMALETRLADAHWTRVRNRDRNATYNKYDIAAAKELTPGFDWRLFLDAAGIGADGPIIIRQPSYFEAMSSAIEEASAADWKTYFKYKLISNFAPNLPAPFVDAHFDFFSHTLRGIEENRPRWKRAVEETDKVLGEAVGKMYVDRHFQPESKARMDEMVANLRTTFEIAIDELEWMSDETRAEAQAKLAKFTTKIGYPDKWKDYSGLVIRADELIGNLLRSADVEYQRMIDKLGKPIDRGEWFMTPQTVNAYYNPPMNEIVFPAAILQPPFFNVAADDAVNYGAIGAVIGHEFSHGFDDQGRKSDGDGNLRDWWTEQDAEEFGARASGLVKQYNRFSPIDGEQVNGELTLGENIGDLSGLTMAYKAYRLSLDGEEAPIIDGFSGDQRLFLGWGQVWRRKYREDELLRRLRTDPHSPSHYRVVGVLSNMPEFHAAFDVSETDGMYLSPEERVKIW